MNQTAGKSTSIGLQAKVTALRQGAVYPESPTKIKALETHMSWVFLAGDKAYKLKKPVRLPYLDFSTLEKREQACRCELSLNRRLAPGIYLDVTPLRAAEARFQIGGTAGEIVDWLVVMRRLDERHTLEKMLVRHQVDRDCLFQLENLLIAFYRSARPARPADTRRPQDWRRLLTENRNVLLHKRLNLPTEVVVSIDRVQRRFVDIRADLLEMRYRNRHVVDGHGDLRPDHIFFNDAISIIDCLEFNPALRAVDPFDEIAYLAVECERRGMKWMAERIIRRLLRTLPDSPPHELIGFYKCYRATLRARLAIAHLLDARVRAPAKWRPLALEYLAIARREAAIMERQFTLRTSRANPDLHGACGSRSQRASRLEGIAFSV